MIHYATDSPREVNSLDYPWTMQLQDISSMRRQSQESYLPGQNPGVRVVPGKLRFTST